ncbi:MAG: hypothetical protein KAV87_36455, partial [Desulfobacteraceae bacterium]|nr:hypothetical protein [Desulfobacteraceae bacterium]
MKKINIKKPQHLPKLYLHIGTHKTGTSAIQSALISNAKRLKREGIIHISPWPFAKNMNITFLNSPPDVNAVQEFRTYLLSKKRRYSKKQKFVMSYEGFSGSIIDGYANSSIIAEVMRKITNGFNVSIIIYLRRQDNFIESAYVQFIQKGESWSFSEFKEKFDQTAFNWLSLVENYARYVGSKNIIVRPYDNEFLTSQGGLLQDFANIIGSESLKNFRKVSNPNMGYTRDALELARLCNPHLSQEDKKHMRQLLQFTNARSVFQKHFYFTPKERERFLDNYLESNAMLARKYLGNS